MSEVRAAASEPEPDALEQTPGQVESPGLEVGAGSIGVTGPLPAAAGDSELYPLPALRRRRLRGLLPPPVRQIGRLLIIALIVEYLLVPQIAGTRKAVHQLINVDPAWLFLGVVLEAASILSYAIMAKTVLPKEKGLGLFTVLRIQLTTLSVSHCVPGGSAAGSSLAYRLFNRAGVRGADVGFALATQGLGSAVVLNVIFWAALVASIPVWGFSPLYLVAAVVGALLLIVLLLLILLFTRGELAAGSWIERRAARIPFVDAIALRGSFVRVAFRLRELGRQRRTLGLAVVWATANWLFDAASLYVFVGAFGHWVNPDGLLVSYGLANVLAAIPLTPGGLGVVEATLTSTLVGFDTPRSIAILGVVSYRLINFWLPIPLGGVTYASLQVDSGHPEEPNAVRRIASRVRLPWRHRTV
jgi:uncharacterized protein (TIRG00374 family)